MTKLKIYRIVTDGGFAPHISDGHLTLTICKPKIRVNAKVGEYILALVAQGNEDFPRNIAPENKHFLAAYLFKVTEVVRMEEYEAWCKEHSGKKICTEDYFEGNCQYGPNRSWRLGPHGPEHAERNLGGKNSIISNYYAAWKSKTPHILTDSDIEGLGVTRDMLRKLAQGHRNVELPDTATVDRLIDEWRIEHPENIRGGYKRRTTRKKSRKN
jgi:Nucleotide modification associated domain 2